MTTFRPKNADRFMAALRGYVLQRLISGRRGKELDDMIEGIIRLFPYSEFVLDNIPNPEFRPANMVNYTPAGAKPITGRTIDCIQNYGAPIVGLSRPNGKHKLRIGIWAITTYRDMLPLVMHELIDESEDKYNVLLWLSVAMRWCLPYDQRSWSTIGEILSQSRHHNSYLKTEPEAICLLGISEAYNGYAKAANGTPSTVDGWRPLSGYFNGGQQVAINFGQEHMEDLHDVLKSGPQWNGPDGQTFQKPTTDYAEIWFGHKKDYDERKAEKAEPVKEPAKEATPAEFAVKKGSPYKRKVPTKGDFVMDMEKVAAVEDGPGIQAAEVAEAVQRFHEAATGGQTWPMPEQADEAMGAAMAATPIAREETPGDPDIAF